MNYDQMKSKLPETPIENGYTNGNISDTVEQLSSLSAANGDGSNVDTCDNDEDRICVMCNSQFNLLHHKRFYCKVCALSVCMSCAEFDEPGWICRVCHH